jgi:hypothetical protein
MEMDWMMFRERMLRRTHCIAQHRWIAMARGGQWDSLAGGGQ